MIELSLCMIVKNEEKNLDNCLKSVEGIFDEINIVDTGSTDKTVEIAKKYTDRIFFYEWHDDFAAARNFSFSQATKEYIMWLDADDIVTSENALKLKKLKKILTRDILYVSMQYHYNIDEDGRPLMTHMRERIVKKKEGFLWVSPIHEYIRVSGKGLTVDVFITHNHRNCEKKSHDRNSRILKNQIELGNDDIRIIRYYATSLYEEKKYDESLKYLELFIERNKEENIVDTDIYIYAHEIYIQKNEKDKAFDVLKSHEYLLGDTSEYYCALGNYFKDAECDNEKALENYFKALECKAADSIKREEEFYYFQPNLSIGKTYIAMGDYQKALKYFDKAYSYWQRQDVRELIEKLKKAVGLMAKL